MSVGVLFLTAVILLITSCLGWRESSIESETRWDIIREIIRQNPSIDITKVTESCLDKYEKELKEMSRW